MAATIERVSVATITLWGKFVGAVSWDDSRQFASFEYSDEFLRSGYDISPIRIPRRKGIFSFPTLTGGTFMTLPGVLADSLPDRFGNALIDAWLSRQGRSKEDFNPVERLCYVGSRGMGALEFKPTIMPRAADSVLLEVGKLVELAQEILADRKNLQVNLEDEKAVETIFKIGTSAGGARAKALVAWNSSTGEIRSGHVAPPPGFESWILKFDGVKDDFLGDSQGYGRIEYAYHKMAVDTGIEMMDCRLYEESGRAHFMTKRFDRSKDNAKTHMQSLCGLGHLDYQMAGAHGYEQAFGIIQQLNIGYPALKEMFRRMVFNIVARNQDDHTRNIAFLMGENGSWRLSPAFDMIWAYNPDGDWTSSHQMSVHGKRDSIDRSDLKSVGSQFGIKDVDEIVDSVLDVVKDWPAYASQAGVASDRATRIGATHRLSL